MATENNRGTNFRIVDRTEQELIIKSANSKAEVADSLPKPERYCPTMHEDYLRGVVCGDNSCRFYSGCPTAQNSLRVSEEVSRIIGVKS